MFEWGLVNRGKFQGVDTGVAFPVYVVAVTCNIPDVSNEHAGIAAAKVVKVWRARPNGHPDGHRPTRRHA